MVRRPKTVAPASVITSSQHHISTASTAWLIRSIGQPCHNTNSSLFILRFFETKAKHIGAVQPCSQVIVSLSFSFLISRDCIRSFKPKLKMLKHPSAPPSRISASVPFSLRSSWPSQRLKPIFSFARYQSNSAKHRFAEVKRCPCLNCQSFCDMDTSWQQNR